MAPTQFIARHAAELKGVARKIGLEGYFGSLVIGGLGRGSAAASHRSGTGPVEVGRNPYSSG